jgi:hypothetical protein
MRSASGVDYESDIFAHKGTFVALEEGLCRRADTTLSSRITRFHRDGGELLSRLTVLCLAGRQVSEIVAYAPRIGSGGHVRLVPYPVVPIEGVLVHA